MNFSEYTQATEGVKPLYQVEGSLPKCPRGHKWSMKNKRCEPKSEKDSVSDSHNNKKDAEPKNGPGYNTWGATGVNGDGYAWAEPSNWGAGGGADGGGVA